MSTQILDHFLKNDVVLAGLFEKKGLPLLPESKPEAAYFSLLCQDIVSQQLGTKVASLICQRFETAVGGESGIITPEKILERSPDELRALGLSWAKVRAVIDLAEKVVAGSVQLESLSGLSDQEVIDHLVQVKGIGQWTAEMFLIFTMGRPDIFSPGDFALRKAMHRLYEHQDEQPREVLQSFAERWAPYRSYASLALWRLLDE